MAFMGSEGRGSATGYAIIGGGWFEKPGVTRLTRSLLFFFIFLLKRYRFDFFKKKDPTDPVKTRSKPGIQVLD
jgi:hypothetical protein